MPPHSFLLCALGTQRISPQRHKRLCNGSHLAGPQERPTPEVKRGVQVEAHGALLWLFLIMFPVAWGAGTVYRGQRGFGRGLQTPCPVL